MMMMKNVHGMMMRLVRLLVGLALIFVERQWVAAGSVAATRSHVSDRSLREIITTTACRFIRRAEDYPARLDLIYVYFLDYYGDSPLELLAGIERAIATTVASTLNDCDDQHYPVFALELSEQSQHILIGTADACTTCSDLADSPGAKRSVVRGITSILMETGAAGMEDLVYALIQATLRDTVFLRSYSSANVTRAVFNRTIAENQIVISSVDGSVDDESDATGESSGGGGGTAMVAVAAAIVSFVLTSIFLFGLYRQHSKRHALDPDTPTKERVARIQAKRRRYFQELEDDPSLAPGWMVTDTTVTQSLPQEQPSVTWSVSDLTSDAESIISSLPLDRIEEENSIDRTEEEDLEMAGSSMEDLPEHSPVHINQLQFVANWSDAMHGESYVEESKVEEPGYYDTIDEGSDSPLNQSARPFWLADEDSIEVNNNNNNNTDVEGAGTPTDPLQGCRFVTDDDIESGADGDDEDSTTLELSEDEDNTEAAFRYEGFFVKDNAVDSEDMAAFHTPLNDISNTVEEDATDIENDKKGTGKNAAAPLPAAAETENDLSSWARGVLTKLKQNVQLLTYDE